MRVVVCVPPDPCDCYGHLQRYAEQFALAVACRSIDVEALYFEDPRFLARLFTALADPDCVVHFHAFLYDLSVSASPARARIVHAAETGRAQTLATVMDHPLFDFMQDMVRNAHPATNFVVTDPALVDEMCFLNPALRGARIRHLPIGAPVNFDATLAKAFGERTFDLLVPMLLIDMAGHDIRGVLSRTQHPGVSKAIEATYDALLHDLDLSPFHVFSHKLRTEFGASLFDIRQHRPDLVPVFLELFNSIDGIVRQERRHRMVRTLLRSVGSLKVGILADPSPALDIDDRVSFLGRCGTPDTVRLMADSRAMFNCNSSYPTHLHERITVGMMNGSCIITDINDAVRDIFSGEPYVGYGLNSAVTIEDIFEERDVESIAEAGHAFACHDVRFSWAGYLDGLFGLVAS